MSEQPEKILRFDIFRRIEHWANAGSFITLGLTGLIQKYAEANLSKFILTVLGGIESVRIIHRIAAILLVLLNKWLRLYARLKIDLWQYPDIWIHTFLITELKGLDSIQ